MDHRSLRISPQWTPRPLQPSPWNTPQISPVSATTPDLLPDVPPLSPLYLSTVTRPIQEPNDIIHDFYNVAPVSFRLDIDGSVPQTVDMPLLNRSSSRPTHALAILSSLGQPLPITPTQGLSVRSEHSSSAAHPPPSPSSPSSPYTPVQADPFLLPIDASLFSAKFNHDVARSLASVLPKKSTSALIRRDRSTGTQLVTLPLIPLYVPHPPSIPHLLLFGQGLPVTPDPGPSTSQKETPNYSRPTTARPPLPPPPSPSTLATYLLPICAIEEFPAAPAMAETMALQCTEAELRARAAFNQGLWRNVLLLAPADPAVVDLARVAWNVTAEARRLRGALSLSWRSKSPRFADMELPALNVQ